MITTREIPTGVQLYVRLLLPDRRCIDFQTATVRWCQSGKIGLEVSLINEDHGRPLSDLLHRSMPEAGLSNGEGRTVHVARLEGAAHRSEAAECWTNVRQSSRPSSAA